MLTDAITRMLPGTLRNEDAYTQESHYDGLLEYPQYTRPWSWRGPRQREDILKSDDNSSVTFLDSNTLSESGEIILTPPEVLRSGHHANIKAWQREQSILRTKQKRPDLWERALAEGLVTENEINLH